MPLLLNWLAFNLINQFITNLVRLHTMFKPQAEFLWYYASFMQLAATLFFSSIVMFYKFPKHFFGFDSEEFSILDITIDNYLNSDERKGDSKSNSEWVEKKSSEYKDKAKKVGAYCRYFSHHSMYMFLFCFCFLIIIPLLSYISDVSIYRVSVLFSLLTALYLIVLFWILKEIKQINPYKSVLFPFILLLVISLYLCSIAYQNHFPVAYGYISKHHFIIVFLVAIFSVMLDFLYLVTNIMLLALNKKEMDNLHKSLTEIKVKQPIDPDTIQMK